MENASKALIIAAGVLLAIMVLAILVYFFRSLRVMPNVQDMATELEQMRVFNLEYEVYDKKLMYGVDVLSALNKAKSNNEKYVDGFFLSGTKDGDEFLVNVEFTIKNTPLEESIVVSYIKKTISTDKEYEAAYNEGAGPTPNVSAFGNKKDDKFERTDEYKTNISNLVDTLKTQNKETSIAPGTYDLNNTKTQHLLTCADNIRQIVKNTDPNANKFEGGWSTAEWKTALYDLKTRKFKCTKLEYSDKTGRVNYLAFEEIK